MTTAHQTLVSPQSLGLSRGMTNAPDTPPPSPLRLTPARLLLLALGVLALFYIIGALTGGVSNYQTLRDARDAALSAEEASAP